MKNNALFNLVKTENVKRNVFDMSHTKLLSCNWGDLIPIFCEEVMPGDKWINQTELMARVAPLISPAMARLDIYTHFFFVPMDLVFKNWGKFITGGEKGTDTTPMPVITLNNARRAQFQKGMLPDYMGVPPLDNTLTHLREVYINALPFRAYQLIYNEYYRDQNLQDPIAITTDDTVSGTEQVLLTTLRKRSWQKDYLTSCLPEAQKGGEVIVPSTIAYKSISDVKTPAGAAAGAQQLTSSSAGKLGGSVQGDLRVENLTGVDISINDLRQSNALQRFMEKAMRGGSRLVETILVNFGVHTPDYRLSRPEYIGGSKQPIVISEVLSTVGNEDAPQGSMAGHGISVGNQAKFRESFTEHGYIIGIMSILPQAVYSQGLPRMFNKLDKLDFPWPDFAHLGEQEVYQSEVKLDLIDGPPVNTTFGYQSRYAEYKFGRNTIAGDFHDDLSHWHIANIYDGTPGLNETFIVCNPPHRLWAVTDPNVHKFYIQIYHDVKAIRPLPTFGTPSF